jgi:hypothetical protein
VHTERYGTRWSGIVTVPAAPEELPMFCYADGPACGGKFIDARTMWGDPSRAGRLRQWPG